MTAPRCWSSPPRLAATTPQLTDHGEAILSGMAHDLGQIVVAPAGVDEIGEHADAKVAIGETVDSHGALGETLIIDSREPSTILALQMTGDASPVAVGRMAASEETNAVGRRANRDSIEDLIATSDRDRRPGQTPRRRIDGNPLPRHRARDALRPRGSSHTERDSKTENGGRQR